MTAVAYHGRFPPFTLDWPRLLLIPELLNIAEGRDVF
jgi:hypothetical protein